LFADIAQPEPPAQGDDLVEGGGRGRVHRGITTVVQEAVAAEDAATVLASLRPFDAESELTPLPGIPSS
jgi:hypothetical protein